MVMGVVALLVTLASLYGLYVAHFVNAEFGSQPASLSILALVVSCMFLKKCMKACPCNKKGACGKDGACSSPEAKACCGGAPKA